MGILFMPLIRQTLNGLRGEQISASSFPGWMCDDSMSHTCRLTGKNDAYLSISRPQQPAPSQSVTGAGHGPAESVAVY